MNPETGNPVAGRGDTGTPISYAMSVDAILSVEDGQAIRQPGDVVARIPREGAEDQGHYRGSSPRGGIVRGAAAEGSRDDRGNRWSCRFGKDYKNSAESS